MLHRPLFPGTRPEETACHPASREVDLDRESIWISYCPMPLGSGGAAMPRPVHLSSPAGDSGVALGAAQNRRRHSTGSHPARLADHLPRRRAKWRRRAAAEHPLCYSAGAMVLSKKHPRVIRYRSPEPVLTPERPQERSGMSPTSFSLPASTAAMILACPTASTSTTGWPTAGLAWRALMCRSTCHREEPPTRRKRECDARTCRQDQSV